MPQVLHAVGVTDRANAPVLHVLRQSWVDGAPHGGKVLRADADANLRSLFRVACLGLRALPCPLRDAFELLLRHVPEHLVVDAGDERARPGELARALESLVGDAAVQLGGRAAEVGVPEHERDRIEADRDDRGDGKVDRRGEA